MTSFNRDNNRVVWFDLPVSNLERASQYYAEVLNCKVEIESFNDFPFSVIEHRDGNGGCLVPDPEKVSSDKGPLLYFNVHGRLKDAVSKAKNKGTIIQDIHPIGPHGFRAIILDSEGNRIALHAEDL